MALAPTILYFGDLSNLYPRRVSSRTRPVQACKHSETSFEGLVDTDRADRRHPIFRQGTRVGYPARKQSGLLLTLDRYLCEAAEIQGTGCRRRQIDNTRLEVRASIINRDYN